MPLLRFRIVMVLFTISFFLREKEGECAYYARYDKSDTGEKNERVNEVGTPTSGNEKDTNAYDYEVEDSESAMFHDNV